MTVFASSSLSGRTDPLPPVLYFDAEGPIEVDADKTFTKRIGRRHARQGVRFAVLFTPGTDVSAAAFSVSLGTMQGRLAYDDGRWSVGSPDAEGDAVPVAQGLLLEGVEYAISLSVDTADGLWREVIVEGAKVAPQVVDLVPGPQRPVEAFVVDLATGGPEVSLPDWVQRELAQLGAEELYDIARERGGRVELTRTPEPEVERVLRAAPLAVVDGDPVFTFEVTASGGPLTVERAWAVEV